TGSRVEIAVSDTGRGIRAELLPHLFEGFPRAGARPGGLGVGLSLVRHLVEAHGGAVLAESAGEGHGATFTGRLPRLRGAASARRGFLGGACDPAWGGAPSWTSPAMLAVAGGRCDDSAARVECPQPVRPQPDDPRLRAGRQVPRRAHPRPGGHGRG